MCDQCMFSCDLHVLLVTGQSLIFIVNKIPVDAVWVENYSYNPRSVVEHTIIITVIIITVTTFSRSHFFLQLTP